MRKLFSLLLVISFFPTIAFSVYDSFDGFREQLSEAGYPVVMMLGAGDFSTKVYVNGNSEPVSINDYVNGSKKRKVRRPSFDYVNENSGQIEFEAYKVSDVFVCYMKITKGRKIRRATFEIVKAKPSYQLAEDFDYCLIIPAPIDEVEKALARVKYETIDSNRELESKSNN
jgi:hypothetical protein